MYNCQKQRQDSWWPTRSTWPGDPCHSNTHDHHQINDNFHHICDNDNFQYPWLANLGFSKKSNSKITYNCGGSLISSR